MGIYNYTTVEAQSFILQEIKVTSIHYGTVGSWDVQ